jgi:hypothetical protein
MRPTTSAALCAPPQMFHSFSRKFRSKLQMAPAAFAAFMPSMMTSPVVSDNAAKIPPLWNQRTPFLKMAPQSKSPGLSWAPASLERL